MIKDLSKGKCSCGYFAVSSTTRDIKIPDDAKGVKIFCKTEDVFFNVNSYPEIANINELGAGGCAVAGVLETRILQDGVGRTLYIKAKNECEALVEFWG